VVTSPSSERRSRRSLWAESASDANSALDHESSDVIVIVIAHGSWPCNVHGNDTVIVF